MSEIQSPELVEIIRVLEEQKKVPVELKIKPEFTSSRRAIYAREVTGTIWQQPVKLYGKSSLPDYTGGKYPVYTKTLTGTIGRGGKVNLTVEPEFEYETHRIIGGTITGYMAGSKVDLEMKIGYTCSNHLPYIERVTGTIGTEISVNLSGQPAFTMGIGKVYTGSFTGELARIVRQYHSFLFVPVTNRLFRASSLPR